MAEWTTEAVAARFADAARTAHRLPPVRVQGYFNLWPPFVRSEAEALCSEDQPPLHFPPSPAEIERMLVTMRWVQWLEVEQRHLVWMRAERYRWSEIAKRFGFTPRTAQRKWHCAASLVVLQLNYAEEIKGNQSAVRIGARS